jgi:hypothetical protein
MDIHMDIIWIFIWMFMNTIRVSYAYHMDIIYKSTAMGYGLWAMGYMDMDIYMDMDTNSLPGRGEITTST